MKLPDKIYTVLKYLAIIGLPALATFIAALFKLWDIPYGDQIAQTITLVATLIGALICVSTIAYNKNKDGDSNE